MAINLVQPLHGRRKSHVRWADIPNGDILIFVPGFIGNALSTWVHFPSLISRQPTENADIVFFGHNGGKSQIQSIVGLLSSFVTQLWERPASFRSFPADRPEQFRYRRIFLCGHSMGGIIARDVAVSGAERNEPWAKFIAIGLFAPAHKGISSSLLIAEKFAKATAFVGQWPLLAFNYFYPVINDLRPESRYLTGLEQRTATLSTGGDYALNVIARFVAFGEMDNVVEQDRFAADPYPPIILENKDHVTVCKPIPYLFETPFDILAEALS